MELKTFEDFEALSNHREIDHYTLNELRQEAIKWVQSSREEKIVTEEGEVFDNPYYVDDVLLQKFFNITEEDLK